MGINIEFNPDLALRNIEEFKKGGRKEKECVPEQLEVGKTYPFLKKGAKIVWADIDLKTRVVTAKTIEQCITEKTKAIVVVHLYGYCADMPAIMALAKIQTY